MRYRSRIFKVRYNNGFSLWVSATGEKHQEMFRYHATWAQAAEFVFSGTAAKENHRIRMGLI